MIRKAALSICAVTALAACAQQSSTSIEGNVPLNSYYMVGIGADAVPERNIAIRFTGRQVIGSGPCNTFVADNAATLPAIRLTNFQPETKPCKDAAEEQRFFNAMRSATSANYEGGVLLVKGPTYMQFEPGRPQ